MATAKFHVFPSPREFVNEGSSVTFYIYPTWDTAGTATPLEKGLTIPWTLSGVDSSDIVGGKTAGVFVIPTIQGASDYGYASVKIQLLADKKTEGDEKLTLSMSDGSDWVTVKDTSPDPVITQLSDFVSLDPLYIPKLVSVTALEKHLSSDWTEQNSAVYGSQKDNQLSYTNGSATTSVSKAASDLVGLSTATYVSKAVFDTVSQTYYDSSVSFALKGVDKTNFSLAKKYTGPSNGTTAIAFSTGASTTAKDDDVAYTNTWSQSSKSGTTSLSDKLSYKDGLGTSLSWNSSWTDKNNGSTTDFSEVQSITYIDTSKNKISFEFSCTGSDSRTLSSANFSAGSADLYEDNASTKISWAKTALTDASFTPDNIYGLVNGSSSFPLNDLLEKINPYIYQSANTIAISSLVGNDKSIDAGEGNDKVTGGNGNETLLGGLGNDILSGGAGGDVLSGGLGSDKLTGGKGNDIFKISKSDFDFTSAKTVSADTIADFKYTATEKDLISLDGFGSFATFQTVAVAKKAGSTANVIYESKTGNFWYNEDGDSALAGALLFANAKGIPDTYWVAAGVLSL